MGRPERQLDPDAGPLQRFAFDLRQLRSAAGRPSYRELAKRAHFSVTALSEAAGGALLPSLALTVAYVRACGGDEAEWEERWRQLAEILAPSDCGEVSPEPFLGLATFQRDDADRFFGRAGLVKELCARLVGSHFLVVFAPSGAGKSSLLRAGLLPAIAAGDVVGGMDWEILLMTPGAHPVEELTLHLASIVGTKADGTAGTTIAALREALLRDPLEVRLFIRRFLAGRAEGSCFLIVVDQFEEVFTLCSDESERAAFISLLIAAAEETGGRVMLGVRADFYARCAAYPTLVEAMTDRQFLIGPMGDEDLRQVVTGPARWAGLQVEQALLEAAVAEARDRPGVLPLLSHALLETWRRRRGRCLTLADYRAAGGVRGAMVRTAERVYRSFGADRRRLVREVFLRLTAFGDGTEDTRRRATVAELLGGRPDGTDPKAMAEVLSALTAARLVTVDDQGVTVAHEALIAGWPRLRGWLTEDRDQLRTHRRLTEAAAEWEHNGRDVGFLYRGARLNAWDDRPLDGLNALEREFLTTSVHRVGRERSARRRRVRLALSGLVAAVTAVSLLAGVAFVLAGRAAAERDLAMSRQLIAEARGQLALDPQAALALSRRAYGVRPTPEAELAMRQALVEHRVIAAVPGHSGRGLGVTFSPDGAWLASSGEDGRVLLWRWTVSAGLSGTPTVLQGPGDEVWTPTFSPDGRRLAGGGLDGAVRVWDLDRPGAPMLLDAHAGPVWSVDFSPDGRRLAGAYNDGSIRVWDSTDSTGAAARTVWRAHEGAAVTLAFSPDGSRIASGGHDGVVHLWNADGSGEPVNLMGDQRETKSLAFSPDGSLLAGASTDGAARIWQTNGQGTPVVLSGHQGTVEGVAFSPDGRWVATTGDDTTVRVWSRTGTGQPLILRGHRGTAWAVTFSPEGSRLASVGDDGLVRLWDPRGGGDPLLRYGHKGAVWSAEFAGGGGKLASGGEDGIVRVWNAGVPGDPVLLRGHEREVLGVSVSPDGQKIASASRDGTIRIWDLAGGMDPVVLRGHERFAWVAVFGPDGRWLASAGRDGTIRIWQTAGGDATRVIRADAEQIRDLDVSHDGGRIATAGADGIVRVWDARDGAGLVVLRGHQGRVLSVAFAPDGRSLASAGSDGTVRLWALDDPARPATVLRGHLGLVWHVAFSPDGRWLASGGKDNTVRVWDTVLPGQPITFSGFGASVESVSFDPAGRRLVTAHDDGTVRTWECLPCQPVAQLLELTRSAGVVP